MPAASQVLFQVLDPLDPCRHNSDGIVTQFYKRELNLAAVKQFAPTQAEPGFKPQPDSRAHVS